MYQTYWIGLSDSAAEGSYRWESDNSLVNYTHSKTDEPNDAAGAEDCVTVLGGAGYWNDYFCDLEKYFICEKPGGMFHCFSSMVLEVEKSSTHLPFEFLQKGTFNDLCAHRFWLFLQQIAAKCQRPSFEDET